MLIVSSPYPPTLTLTLPMPPGSNERVMPAVVNGKRRMVLTQQARAWLEAAAQDVFFQRKGGFIGNRAAARVSLSPSNYDADAPVKLLFDGLEDGGAVTNDRNIRPYFVCDDATVPDGKIRVELWDTGEAMPARGRTLTAEEAHRSMVNRALARTFRR